MEGEEKKEENKIENKIEQEKEELKEGAAREIPKKEAPPRMREIIIHFDSQRIEIVKSEVASVFEFQAVLEQVIKKINPN
jgi:hypothetical protein